MLFNTVAIAVFAGCIGTEIKFQPEVKGMDTALVLNVAVTFLLASIVTVHVGNVPEQSPDHPAKEEPAEG